MTTSTFTFDTISSEALQTRADEASWLTERRGAALKQYADRSWPNSRLDEFWRSTPFHKLVKTDAPLAADGTEPTATAPESLAASQEPAALVTIIDGVVSGVFVSEAAAAKGLVVLSLADASSSHEDLVAKHLGSLTTLGESVSGVAEDRTIAANDAAWDGGVFVHVPANVEIAGPIGIHVHATRTGVHLPRVLAVAEHHAKAMLYIEHTSPEDTSGVLVDEVAEIVIGDAAQISVVSMQEWSGDVVHLSLQKAAVGRDATFRHMSVNVGGTTVRLRPEADLVGKGGSAFIRGIYFADEGQHFDLQPYVRHIASHATSDTLFKGALQGKCRTVFRGNVLIGEHANGTVTDETNRSLILTPGAKADSTPFLEIFNHDVKAGHGSATGQVEGSYLWYLQSRGISRAEALRLIVFGFFTEVLDQIEAPGVRDRALEHLETEISSTDLSRVGVTNIVIPEA